ncbi:gas vesicle protein GvpO [Nocardia huaxiensis]|uniref:Gas vesicle protein n=1 Tax=Nocardia huaxiensis TaxID=2755382 RepID=A0A7D6VGH3_9NOCA|nr:gas vesicle protein GvpO [Nocardia huaxiensis]QLY33922.1 gas vesicle protein [Nocardia huaxiensis]UFS99141.1 gas vesicle protein [Nocardia huaxiensis]
MTDEQRSRTGKSAAGDRLSASQTAAAGTRHIAELTGKEVVGATGVRPRDDGWTVEVEVLEDAHIPSSADVLALYELELDENGELLSYRRIRRGRRCAIGDDRS